MSALTALGIAVLAVPAALFVVIGVLALMYAMLEDTWHNSRKEFWVVLAVLVWASLGLTLIIVGTA